MGSLILKIDQKAMGSAQDITKGQKDYFKNPVESTDWSGGGTFHFNAQLS